ncbi:hypothetical protein AAFC00_001845 [Neodothiora populina]|uniref:FAD/NAD(P)-binding domain-containing protein n=1 Tax=Neodothiora populina TaxID=2781224 RepID=A0ABR3PQC5_9PEZI
MGRRFASEISAQRTKYAAVVVGGGPAGITVVGNLLERDVKPLLWVDDQFKAGRVNRAYREVPSNTKVKLFVDFAEATAPFRKVLEETPSPHAIDYIRKLPQDKGCELGYAADMCLMLTDGLRSTPGVESRQGRVSSATLDSTTNTWTVDLQGSSSQQPKAQTDRLILCTGSSPNSQTLPVTIPNLESFELDHALSPTILAKELPSTTSQTVAVIGASHSAILVLINLFNLTATTHPHLRIKWFTRHPLRYAEYMDGWILRDNTGLKGAAAAWAKANLEPDVFASSPVSRVVEKIEYKKENEVETYERHLPQCQRYIQAIGYIRDPSPELKTSEGKAIEQSYNHETGGFADVQGDKVPGLYGAGIAWPERVTDPYGNVEYAVGFFKFMKYIKRVVGEWN